MYKSLFLNSIYAGICVPFDNLSHFEWSAEIKKRYNIEPSVEEGADKVELVSSIETVFTCSMFRKNSEAGIIYDKVVIFSEPENREEFLASELFNSLSEEKQEKAKEVVTNIAKYKNRIIKADQSISKLRAEMGDAELMGDSQSILKEANSYLRKYQRRFERNYNALQELANKKSGILASGSILELRATEYWNDTLEMHFSRIIDPIDREFNEKDEDDDLPPDDDLEPIPESETETADLED
jgi:hypothetical protein